MPAALGGILTPQVVPALRCRAIVGPANNQLSDDSVADLLHARDITWAPDPVVSSGGIVGSAAREINRLAEPEVENGSLPSETGSVSSSTNPPEAASRP